MTIEDTITKMNLPFTPVELQVTDAYEAASAGRFLLEYDVGGGKTFVSTVVALYWNAPHTIVCMPHILIPQWKRWLTAIGETDIGVYYGAKRLASTLDHKWILMSHSGFRDSFKVIEERHRGKDTVFLLDEAQAIKNVKSQLYKKLSIYLQPDRRIILMTATPISKYEDTYTYMAIKTPNLYRSFSHWTNLHVEEINIFKQPVKYGELDLLESNFAIKRVKRNKKELFGDTLTPIIQPLEYDLAPAHLKLYNKLAEEQLLLLPDGGKVDATTAQKLRHKLQQIVVNYSDFSGIQTDVSSAYELIDSIIEQVDPFGKGKSKLVIWTWYQATSRALTKYLRDKYGVASTAAAYGGVDSAKGVHQIMYENDCRLAVFHPQSVGAGLELQHVCWEMLFIETSTSPIYNRQALGRFDRPGQKYRPTARFAQAQGTIQPTLYEDLLNNDMGVSRVLTMQSLRDQIFGRVGKG